MKAGSAMIDPPYPEIPSSRMSWRFDPYFGTYVWSDDRQERFHAAMMEMKGFKPKYSPHDLDQGGEKSSGSEDFVVRSSYGLDDLAFQGPIGEFALRVAPHTEASPVAIRLTLLTYFGIAVGNGPYVLVGDVRQTAALNVVIVGKTAKARKGTSGASASRVSDLLDPDDGIVRVQRRKPPMMGGFGSGETLIDAIRDPSGEDDDSAPTDKRLVIFEPEFASVLRRMGRENSILGPTIRALWDGSEVAARSRGAGSVKATNYHVGVVGHITEDELKSCLTSTEIQSGTANRILWVRVERARRLPRGGNTPPELAEETAAKLREAYDKAVQIRGPVGLATNAYALWDRFYDECADDDPAGLVGAAIARAEANVLRLALIYALADGRAEIRIEHLQAAIAVWNYCRASADTLFGNQTGNKNLDKLLQALSAAGSRGLSRTEISSQVFSRNLKGSQLNDVLTLGLERGLIEKFKRDDSSGVCYRLRSTNSTNPDAAA